jgi:hypothetical protein
LHISSCEQRIHRLPTVAFASRPTIDRIAERAQELEEERCRVGLGMLSVRMKSPATAQSALSSKVDA